MFTATRLTTKTTSVTTGPVDYTNHTGLALCGHIILPEFECTLVGPGQYPRYTSAVKDGLRADARLNYSTVIVFMVAEPVR